MDWKLLIEQKQNVEAYKSEIESLRKEISNSKDKMDITMFPEEKKMIAQEIANMEDKIQEYEKAYNEKRERLTQKIQDAKKTEIERIEKIEKRKISKKDYDDLAQSKKEKDEELKKIINKIIPDLKNKINKVNENAQNMGYELDITSIAQKLDSQVAYKTYLQSEIEELDSRLDDAIIIEDNMEELKEIFYAKVRLNSLSYDNIEEWNSRQENQNNKRNNTSNNKSIEEDKSTEPNRKKESIDSNKTIGEEGKDSLGIDSTEPDPEIDGEGEFNFDIPDPEIDGKGEFDFDINDNNDDNKKIDPNKTPGKEGKDSLGIPEIGKVGPIIERDEPGKNLPKDSWLQVMRDVFTDENMPEIKGKHNISINPVITKGATGIVAVTTLIATAFIPGLGIAASAGVALGSGGLTALIPTLSRKITGRNKVVKQIREVLKSLPPERFNLLAEGLNEKNIVDYMPNDVFLEAMQKEMEYRTKEIKSNNDAKYSQYMQEQESDVQEYKNIEQKLKGFDLTEEERKDLIAKSISLSARIADKTQTLNDIEKETNKWISETTAIRRGREDKGHNKRGNVVGKLDGLFARKNIQSKDYVPALEEAADKEREILYSNDPIQKAEATMDFREYLSSNSRTKKVRKAAFNFDKSSGRIISDREDNRVQTIANLTALALAGITGITRERSLLQTAKKNYTNAETNARQIESLKNNVNDLNNNDLQSGINAQYAQAHSAAEYTTTVESNAYGGPVYQAADKANNQIVENMYSKVGTKAQDTSDFYSKSARIQQTIGNFTKKFTEAAKNGRYSPGNFQNDHTFAENIHTANSDGQSNLSKIFEDTSELLKQMNNANAEHGVKAVFNYFHNFVPGILFASGIISKRRDNKDRDFGKEQSKEKKDNLVPNDEKLATIDEGDERE